MDPEAVARLIDEHNIETIKVGGADIDGVYRGKRLMRDQFLEAAAGHGFPQCDVLFGWDIQDEIVDGLAVTGWHTGFGDIVMRPDLATFAVVPWEEGTASVICDFYTEAGQPVTVAPRHVLRRVVERAQQAGLRPYMASELEVRFFREDQESLREKGFSNLRPLNPGLNCYSIHHASIDDAVVGRVRHFMLQYGVPVEGYNREHGAGMYEINLRYGDALRAADHTMLYKSGSKEIGAQVGVMPTFMAKYADDVDGCSGHIHQSLWDEGGSRNLFWDGDAEDHISELMRHYVGGILATLPEFMLMHAPNVNSYKRFVEQTWVPTNITWGLDNRTTALRVIAASPGSTRVENRVPGADINPYLGFAASLAGGLYGIERGIEPPPMTVGDAYTAAPSAPPLPGSLEEAVERFEGSELTREYFGGEFVDHFSRFRRWEIRKYQRAVTDWERRRYFEMV